MAKVNPDGFRKDVKPFFNQFVLSVLPEQKQLSPFIIHNGDKISKCATLDDLLEYPDDTEVLQTWPGRKRSDVFYFTVKDIREHLKNTVK